MNNNQYAIFLRGINVGGNNLIAMADLKTCLENSGYTRVKTFLQSGNVLLNSNEDPTTLKTKLETLLSERFNYSAKIVLCTLQELEAIISAYPFTQAGPDEHDYVIFLSDPGLVTELVKDASTLDTPEENVAAGNSVVYWKVQKNLTLKSDFSKLLTKAKYKTFNTLRNLNTLKKMILS